MWNLIKVSYFNGILFSIKTLSNLKIVCSPYDKFMISYVDNNISIQQRETFHCYLLKLQQKTIFRIFNISMQKVFSGKY